MISWIRNAKTPATSQKISTVIRANGLPAISRIVQSVLCLLIVVLTMPVGAQARSGKDHITAPQEQAQSGNDHIASNGVPTRSGDNHLTLTGAKTKPAGNRNASLHTENRSILAETNENRSILAETAAVATAHPEASSIAVEMLSHGGNAVDAAIAAAYAIGVFEPSASGIGGGATALVYIREEDRFYYVDFYQRAPSFPHFTFDSEQIPCVKAIHIPGMVAGLEYLRENWALLDRRTHIRPAIDAARNGFRPDSVLYSVITQSTGKTSVFPESRALFTLDGDTLPPGSLIRNEALAEVMEIIADEGSAGFYSGTLTDTLIARINRHGGRLIRQDFETYDVRVSEPLKGTYRGFEIVTAPPPQSGLTLLQALNMMEHVEFNSAGHNSSDHYPYDYYPTDRQSSDRDSADHHSSERHPLGHYTQDPYSLHMLVEIMKRAYADRTGYLADPYFVPVPVKALVSKAYASHRYSGIDHHRAFPAFPPDTRPGYPLLFHDSSPDTRPGEALLPQDSSPNTRLGEALLPQDSSTDTRLGEALLPQDSSPDTRPGDAFLPHGSPPDTRHGDVRLFQTHEAQPATTGEDLTTHISVIDKDGNMVSLTSTVGLFFGSGVVINGIVFNSSQTLFSKENPKTLTHPRKRGVTTITPTIVMKEGEPYAILGAAGGFRILSSLLLGLHNMMDYDYTAGHANAAPRFIAREGHHRHEFESRFEAGVLETLEVMGHSIRTRKPMEMFFGGMQIIRVRPDGRIEASSDPRRDGYPAGY